MNRKELITAVAQKSHIDEEVVTNVLEALRATIEQNVQKGESTYLHGFCSLTVKNRPERSYKLPTQDVEVAVSGRRRICFTPGKSLKELL